MDKKLKEKRQFILDLEDAESIKCAIIDTRVKYNLSLIQSLFFLCRIIEKESKKVFNDEELETVSFYLLHTAGLYNIET